VADALSSLRTGMKMMTAEHHQDMREIVAGRSAEALNWRPGPDTNSLAVLVIHLLGAEHSCVTTALGSPIPRDRDAEFEFVAHSPEELLAEIDRIDALLPGLIDQISEEDLAAMRTRPNDRLDRERPGIWWLLHSMRQSREHIGQMMLTIQLYDQQYSGA
jgi:hypothetical protein